MYPLFVKKLGPWNGGCYSSGKSFSQGLLGLVEEKLSSTGLRFGSTRSQVATNDRGPTADN
jgi:hypothetical protein